VDFVLDVAGLRRFFRAIANGHDVARPKPAPDIYLHTARMLKVNPADCIVFEDSATGVAAAVAAGMRVVGLLTTLPTFDNVDLAVRNFQDPRLEKWLSSTTVSA
jgi:beta-phosphoglucomutase-like phosphatase (HAD superfamily)